MRLLWPLLLTLISPYVVKSSCGSFSSISDPSSSPQPVVNIAFSYPGGLGELTGVAKDIPRMRAINKRLYGNIGRLFKDGDFLQDCEGSESGISCQRKRKESFLSKMKSFVGDRQNRPVFNYSGHGFRCKKPGQEVQFCMLLPAVEVPIQCEEDEFGLITMNKGCSDYFLTTREIVDRFNPSTIVVDACHSGQMTLDIKRIFSTTTVIASSLSHEKASDWGILFGLLYRMVKAKDEDLCQLDIDQDGQVSLPESLFGIYGSNLKYYKNAISLRNKVSNHNVDKYQTPNFSGFSSSILEYNKCFIKPKNKAKCPTTKSSEREDRKSCTYLVKRMNKVKDSVNKIIDDPDSTKFLFDLDVPNMPALSSLPISFTDLPPEQKEIVRQEYYKNLTAVTDYLKSYLDNYFYPAELACQLEGERCLFNDSFYDNIILKSKIDDMRKVHQYLTE